MPLSRLMLCVAAAAGTIALAACGDEGSNELPSGEAGSLRSALSAVEQRVDSQDCTGATEQAAAFRNRVDALPQSVDSDLKRALASSADRLASLVADQCAVEQAPPAETPDVGTTSQDPTQGNDEDQGNQKEKDKKPKKPKPDEDPTQTQPDTGGAGQEVPPVGDQGGGTPPEE